MASFGEELRRERELRDISLREIAEATNISIRFLEALERNDFDALPGSVYARGFIRSTAKHLGLDVEEVLTSYQAEVQKQEMDLQNMAGANPAGSSNQSSRFAETLVGAGIVFTGILIGVIYWASAATPETIVPSDLPTHDTALNARMKRSGALPPHPSTAIDQASAQPPAGSSLAAATAAAQERLVGIRALETTAIELSCGGEIRFKEELWVGVERQFACREPVLLSAANAGAVEYSVDSSSLTLLGKPGQAVTAFRITDGSKPEAPGGETSSLDEIN